MTNGANPVPSFPSSVTSVSHGEEADFITNGRQFVELGYLASSTALLFRTIEKQGPNFPGLDGLWNRATKFVEVLQDVASNEGSSERDLPYRQLLPVRVWRATVKDNQDMNELARDIPSFLQTVRVGSALQADLELKANLLDDLARTLRQAADFALRRLS